MLFRAKEHKEEYSYRVTFNTELNVTECHIEIDILKHYTYRLYDIDVHIYSRYLYVHGSILYMGRNIGVS